MISIPKVRYRSPVVAGIGLVPAYHFNLKEAPMFHKFDYHVLFDGGSRGNGTATQEGYGSYLIVDARGQRQPVRRLEFGHVTNNEAEYKALLAALVSLVRTIEDAGQDPAGCDVRIVGDSQLVLNQVSGDWKCKKPHLLPLRDEAQANVALFHAVTFEHTPRETCVRLLGH